MSVAVTRLVLAACIAAFGAAAAARPLQPAERRYAHPYSGAVPACQDPAVLERISSRFHGRERAYWSSGLEILGYERVRETGYRSTGLDYIPRRYCRAEVAMNDGRLRQVTYWIGEDLGVIGWGWGVEWCIAGLDRNLAFGAGCKAAGP